MPTFIGRKKDVVQFVAVIVPRLGLDCRSITITKPATSVGYCVRIVTVTSSAAIVKRMARICSLRRIHI